MMRAGVVALVLAAPLAARAQPVASNDSSTPPGAGAAEPTSTTTTAPGPHELTAADVAADPLPGDESGRIDPLDTDSVARRMGRVALFVPKLLLEAAFAPMRAGVWAEDRYQLDELYYRVFYNADRTVGLYPTGTYATGYGITAGARFSAHELFGKGEALALQATTGAIDGEHYHESFLVQANTGRRLGHFQLGADGSFDRRPNDPFYGIGNSDQSPAPSTPVDPRTSDLAFSTRYRYQEARAALYLDARVVDDLHVRATGAIANHHYAAGDEGPPTDDVYATSGLVGWNGYSNAYGELELRIDKRRRASLWEPHDLHAEGWLAAVSVGRVHELDGGADFWRGSAELQQFIRFGMGPRLLALRLRGETVSGSTSEVPFSELPFLGGGDFLRGYDFARFRDRVSLLGSAEYIWDLAHWFDAALYVDAGRVYSSLSAIDADHLRVGYGVALEIYNESSFLFEFSVSSSIDGGLFFNVMFNPVFDNRPRWR
ncbi:MAG TPA: BamA/TamA family outer membrane protein [Kofleriaceae bacterium]|nr:BamA/TamA family outer membrane protein [Kofleriaceae bacterium]